MNVSSRSPTRTNKLQTQGSGQFRTAMNVSSRSPTRTNENWMSNTRDYMKPFGSSDSMMQSIDMDIRKTTGKIEKDRGIFLL